MENNISLSTFFSNVSYTCPSQNEYIISITDPKVSDINVSSFHCMSSNKTLFIYFNDTLPLFKIPLDESILIKTYNINITDTSLQIIITTFDENEKVISFIRQTQYKHFYKKIMNTIYNKYYYQNSISFYLQHLKQKTFMGLQLNYFYKLKQQFLKQKLNTNIASVYYKAFLKKLKQNKQKREIAISKEAKMLYMIFIRKVYMNINTKMKNEIAIQKAIKYNSQRKRLYAIKSLYILHKHNKQLNQCAMLYRIQKIKHKLLITLMRIKRDKLLMNKRISLYNKCNYDFIEYIANKLGYNKYVLMYNKESIKKLFTLLQLNALTRKDSYKQLKDIIIKKVKHDKDKVITIQKCKNVFDIKRKVLFLKVFFRSISFQLLYNKIQMNKQKLFTYIHKQTGVQLFFINISRKLSNKLMLLRYGMIYKKRTCKYKFYDFISKLFLLKKQKQHLSLINIANSFELKSIRALQKKKRKLIQKYILLNIFKNFMTKTHLSQHMTSIENKTQMLKNKKKKETVEYIRNKIKRNKRIRNVDLKTIRNNCYKEMVDKCKDLIREKKFNYAAMKSHNERVMNKCFVVLYYYSKFKSEKTLRDEYYSYQLLKKYKRYCYRLFFSKTYKNVLLGNTIKKQIACKYMKKCIQDIKISVTYWKGKMKRKIFTLLKRNREYSKDLKYFLNEAKDIEKTQKQELL